MGATASEDWLNAVRERGGESDQKFLKLVFVEKRELSEPLLEGIASDKLKFILDSLEIEEDDLRNDPEETRTALDMMGNEKAELLAKKVKEWIEEMKDNKNNEG